MGATISPRISDFFFSDIFLFFVQVLARYGSYLFLHAIRKKKNGGSDSWLGVSVFTQLLMFYASRRESLSDGARHQ